jgi:hypothetical protein
MRFVPRTQYLVPWVYEICSSNIIFLFRDSTFFVLLLLMFLFSFFFATTSVLKYKTFCEAKIVYQNVLYFVFHESLNICTSFFISLVVASSVLKKKLVVASFYSIR